MIHDLEAGVIDVGVLWGPMAGYYAKKASMPLSVVLLTKEKSGPSMTYRIVMGVRRSDQEWKRRAEFADFVESEGIDHLLLVLWRAFARRKDNQIRE